MGSSNSLRPGVTASFRTYTPGEIFLETPPSKSLQNFLQISAKFSCHVQKDTPGEFFLETPPSKSLQTGRAEKFPTVPCLARA